MTRTDLVGRHCIRHVPKTKAVWTIAQAHIAKNYCLKRLSNCVIHVEKARCCRVLPDEIAWAHLVGDLELSIALWPIIGSH